jgi:hypothetical protein
MQGRGPVLAAVVASVLVWALVAAGTASAAPVFKSAVEISPPGQHGFEPQVAVDGSGNVHSVWSRSDGTTFRIQYSTRTPAGDWSSPVNISEGGQDASEPQLAVDKSGNLLVVWTRLDGANLRIQAAFKPLGGSFTTPVSISDPGFDAGQPQVDFDALGKAVAVWSRSDGTTPDLCCRRVQASVRSAGVNGAFQTPVTLSDPGQDGSDPHVDAGPDADANAVVVWTRSDGAYMRVQAARRRDYVAYPRPAQAKDMRLSLVPAFDECRSSAANRSHGPPLAGPSCTPPTATSAALTVGASSSSSVRWKVLAGNQSTEANEADVVLVARITDVRKTDQAGSDYLGRLGVKADLRITDQRNAAEQPESGTSQTYPLEVSIQCAGTAATTAGATCNANTSLNALLPGAVVERKRSIWALGQTVVMDAGPNETGYAACPPTCGDGDERAFLRQGVFIP